MIKGFKIFKIGKADLRKQIELLEIKNQYND